MKFLKGALGSKAVKTPKFDFKGTTGAQATFLKTAMALEDTGVSAYAGAAPMIANKKTLAAALSVHSVEARHAAWVRDILGKGSNPLPAPAAVRPGALQGAGPQDRHGHGLHRHVVTSRAGRARPGRARSRRGRGSGRSASQSQIDDDRLVLRQVVHAAVGGVHERRGAALPGAVALVHVAEVAELRRALVDRREQRGRADLLAADPVAVAERRRVHAEHVDRGGNEAPASRRAPPR